MRFKTHEEISNAVTQNKRDGLCPICRDAPSKHGITCGTADCTTQWIRGRRVSFKTLAFHGIHKYECDYVVHVCFQAKEMYAYKPKDGIRSIKPGHYPKKVASQYVNGRRMITGGGFAVPVHGIRGCHRSVIPDEIIEKHTVSKSSSTSIKGRAAQNVVVDSIVHGFFPIPPSVTETSDISAQIKGKDLVVSNSYGTLEIKCDYRGGSKSRGGTGNLFLQTHEINPKKLY